MNFLFPDFKLPPNPILIYFILVWSFLWKGIALWRAGEFKQKNWFIAILIVNTVGILEMVYLFRFAKKRLTVEELKSWLPKKSPKHIK